MLSKLKYGYGHQHGADAGDKGVSDQSLLLAQLMSSCIQGDIFNVKKLSAKITSVNVVCTNHLTPLLSALARGHADIVQYLLQYRDADVNMSTVEDGYSALFLAAYEGNLTIAHILLRAGADVNQADKKGATPVFVAGMNGHIDVVKLLLSKKADIEIYRADGTSALAMAIQNDQVDVAELLLQNGAHVNHADCMGSTALSKAAYRGHPQTVGLLIQKGGDVQQCNKYGVSPLAAACYNGHHCIMPILIAHGAKVNEASNNGVTPFMEACQMGHVETARHLIANGANGLCTSIHGLNALHFASFCNNANDEMVSYLTNEIGIDVNATTNESHDMRTPFSYAALSCSMDAMKSLVLHGANIEQRDAKGNVCIHSVLLDSESNTFRLYEMYVLDNEYTNEKDFAKRLTKAQFPNPDKRLAAIQFLLDCNIDVNDTNNELLTPLHLASQAKANIIVEYLVKNKAHTNALNVYGASALYIASGNGSNDIVKLLIDHDADISMQDEEGRSPVFMAAANNHPDVMTTLLQAGAEVDIGDNEGITPLAIASERGHFKVVEVIVKNGCQVNKADQNKATALHKACEQTACEKEECMGVIKLLINADIDTLLTDMNEQTCVHYVCKLQMRAATAVKAKMAALSNKMSSVLSYIIDKSDTRLLNMQDIEGNTALHVLCQNSNPDVSLAAVLIKRGIAIDVKNCMGETALMTAVKYNHLTIAKILYSRKASVTVTNNVNMSLLHVACQGRTYHSEMFIPQNTDPDLMIWLLELLDVEARDMFLRTPLHIAALTCNINAVTYLLKHGADPLARDRNHVTPVHMATVNFDAGIFDKLVSKVYTDGPLEKLLEFCTDHGVISECKEVLTKLDKIYLLPVDVKSLAAKHHDNKIPDLHIEKLDSWSQQLTRIELEEHFTELYECHAFEHLKKVHFVKKTIHEFAIKVGDGVKQRLPNLKVAISGSMNEGTRITRPDEGDFPFIAYPDTNFHPPMPINDSKPGVTVFLKVKENDISLKDLCKEGTNELDRDKFFMLVYSAICEELKSEALWEQFPMLYRRSVSDITSFSRNITHLCLWWHCLTYTLMALDLDLVPCIEYPKFVPSWSRNHPLVQRLLAKHGCVAVAKWSETHESSFNLGFTKCDKDLLDEMPPVMKSSYIMGKMMKISSLCPHIVDAPEVGSLIDSYMLKTALFWTYQEWLEDPDRVVPENTTANKIQYTMLIYKKIEEGYSASPCKLEHFYLPNCNLLGDSRFTSYKQYGKMYAQHIQKLLTPRYSQDD